MKPDTDPRKSPKELPKGLTLKEDLKLESTDAQNQDPTVESLRQRFHELCYKLLACDLDPVASLLTSYEIKRVSEAIKTVERLTKETHAK